MEKEKYTAMIWYTVICRLDELPAFRLLYSWVGKRTKTLVNKVDILCVCCVMV